MLVDHCRKSNAGLFYADQDEFTEALEAAARRRPPARRAWAATAAHYVKQNYRWDVIMQKYERLMTRLKG